MPTANRIPISRPDLTEEEAGAVADVVRSGVLSIGPQIEAFERELARMAGAERAVAVSSGTAALHLALLAAGVRPGDEVLTVSLSFVASANAVLMARGEPVFLDVEQDTLNMNVQLLGEVIERDYRPSGEGPVNNSTGARLGALLPVHLFGVPADCEALADLSERYNVPVVEDACEALGASTKVRGEWKSAGTVGLLGTYAFYPNKQLTTGEGGAVVTDDEELAGVAVSLRNQGRSHMGAWLEHERVGFNYRMSELHAAVGRVQLSRFSEMTERRLRVFSRYLELFAHVDGLELPGCPERARHSPFVFTVRLPAWSDRDRVISALDERGIDCRTYFTPIHLQEAYAGRPARYPLPVTEDAGRRSVALPFFNSLTEQQQRRVAQALKEALALEKEAAVT